MKRQTLGLEPAEIAGLVEHRDAMLHGIREGVVGLDLRGRVTLVNDEAIRLLRIPGDALGRTLDDLGVGEEMRDALLSATRSSATGRSPAPGGCCASTGCRSPAAAGRSARSTTLRDRTELLELRRELDLTRHVTDTLRAQAHEFGNRLHTIAGLIELGEADEAVRFVHRISSSRSEFSARRHRRRSATRPSPRCSSPRRARRPSSASTCASRPTPPCPVLDDELSADVATVVGNLVDNALDAAATAPRALGRGRRSGWSTARSTSSSATPGPACPPGWSARSSAGASRPRTGRQAGERGIGLSLVHLVCTRRGGDVTATSAGGSTFTARLPADAETLDESLVDA